MTFSTFSPVQWIAFLITALTLIKLIVVIINKKTWVDIVIPLYKNGKNWSLVFLILSLAVLYYLLQELSIVQIMAVIGFIALFGGFAAMQYSKELLDIAKKMTKQKFSGALWFYIILWLILALWALKELFF
jgi:hypothetical protein